MWIKATVLLAMALLTGCAAGNEILTLPTRAALPSATLFVSFGDRAIDFFVVKISINPSEFISDIPADLLEKEGEEGKIKTIYI